VKSLNKNKTTVAYSKRI